MMLTVACAFVIESDATFNDANDEGSYLLDKIVTESAKSDSTSVTVTLDKDVHNANGIGIFGTSDPHSIQNSKGEKVPFVNANNQGITELTIDLGGHTYSVAQDKLVGSSSTQTQAMHFENNFKVTIINGTIELEAPVMNDNSKMIIQHYCDLTLTGVKLDGTNIAQTGDTYTLSNNSGHVVLENYVKADGTVCPTEIISSKNCTGPYAFDVCNYTDGNTSPIVNVNDDTIIDGRVELFTKSTRTEACNAELNIYGGVFKGPIEAGKLKAATDVTVDFKDKVTAYISDESWLDYVKTPGKDVNNMKTIILKANEEKGTITITKNFTVPDYVSLGVGHSTNVVMGAAAVEADENGGATFAANVYASNSASIILSDYSVFALSPSDKDSKSISSFTGAIQFGNAIVEVKGCESGADGLYFTADKEGNKLDLMGTIDSGKVKIDNDDTVSVSLGLYVKEGATLENADYIATGSAESDIGIVFSKGAVMKTSDGKTKTFERTAEVTGGKIIESIDITVILMDKSGTKTYEAEVLPGWMYGDYFPVISGAPYELRLNGKAIDPTTLISADDAGSTVTVNYSGEPIPDVPTNEKADSTPVIILAFIFVILAVILAFIALIRPAWY